MATVVDIDELVGEDIKIKAGGREYRIPADISTDEVFGLFQAFVDSTKIEGDDPAQVTLDVQAKLKTIEARLLELLQRRHPDLTAVPWGLKGQAAVLRAVLAELGLAVTPDPPADPAPKPASRTTTRKGSPRRK